MTTDTLSAIVAEIDDHIEAGDFPYVSRLRSWSDRLAALGEVEKDAARYRFLRNQSSCEPIRPFICIFAGSFIQLTDENADQEIDTAMQPKGGGK